MIVLRDLQLHNCFLDLDPADFHLPALTRLALSDVGLSSRRSAWPTFFGHASLPLLSAMVLYNSNTVVVHDPQRAEALKLLAPRLVELNLDDEQLWVLKDDRSIWPLFTSLTHLHIVNPEQDYEEGELVTNCLELLPSPLVGLELGADSSGSGFGVTAWHVCSALQTQWHSVRELEMLVLPEVDSFTVDAGSFAAFQLRNACEKLAREASERGIEVVYE